MSGLIDQVRYRRRLPEPAVAKAIRETAGVSLGAVGRELGVHQATVGRWERGERQPRGHHLRQYVDLLEPTPVCVADVELPVRRAQASRTASLMFSHVLWPRYSYVFQSRDRSDSMSSQALPW